MERIALIGILLAIFVQDFQKKAVHWILFPLLLGFSSWYGWKYNLSMQVLINIIFVVFILSFLTLYVSLKQRKLTAIWKGYFNWGDILFLLAITPLFVFPVYLVYFTIGTILTLILHVALLLLTKKKSAAIPYAGYMALPAILFLLLDRTINTFILSVF